MKKTKQILSILMAMVMTLSCFAGLGISSGASSQVKKIWAVSEENTYENGKKISKKIYEYDKNGDLIKSTTKDSYGNWVKEAYKYDSNGNTTECTTKNSDGSWSKGTYEYDSNGNEIKSLFTDSYGYWEDVVYEYDSNGNMIKYLYKDSEKSCIEETHEYNSKGEMIKSFYKDSEGFWKEDSYAYDSKGNEIKVLYKDSDGSWDKRSYEYDSNNNATKDYYKNSDGFWEKQTYAYDSKGNFIKYSYKDSDGNWSKCSNEYDSNSNIITGICKSNYGENYKDSFKYDSNGNVIKNITKYSDSISTVEYKYNSKGYLIKRVEKEDSETYCTISYKYDSKGNMLKETGKFSDGSAYIYEYDAYRNLTKVANRESTGYYGTTHYTYKLINDSSNEETDYCPKFKLGVKSYTYDGKEKRPAVTAAEDGLTPGLDYTVSYSNNVKVGKATVTIKLKGGYEGTVKKTFKIVPKGTKINALTPGKGKVKVKWDKQTTQTTGYQLQYSTSDKFTDETTKTITGKNNQFTSKTLSSLKSGTKYYFRIRTYKTVKGANYYSSWSKKQAVTVK